MKRIAVFSCTALILLGMIWSPIVMARDNLVTNPGFEIDEIINGIPNTYGDWGLDPGSTVPEQRGITPRSGEQMLRFDGTYPDFGTGYTGEVLQLIDISSFSDIVAQGNAVIHGSAYFNRVAGDSQTDTDFHIELRAHTGDPVDFWVGGYIAKAGISFISDSNLASWEELTVSLLLPTETDYIAFAVIAIENVSDDDPPNEFDGHYADDVSVVLLPAADFSASPRSGVAPLIVNFTDKSIGTVDSWDWDFGDASTSTNQNPVHTYLDPDTYTVSLTVTGQDGSDTETKNDYILVTPPDNQPPIADAGLPFCIEYSAQSKGFVQGKASDPDSDPLDYRWLEGTTELMPWEEVGPNGEACLFLGNVPPFSVGSHTLTLEVNDGELIVRDNVVMTVSLSDPNYWTPERMRNAKGMPLEIPADAGEGSSENKPPENPKPAFDSGSGFSR